jgi:dipeptidyl aminopeptidase/acylaminoacyl peptidase
MLIYNDLPIRHWDEWNDEYMSHVFVVPVDTAKGTPKDLMAKEVFESPMKPFGGPEEFTMSPASDEVAYTCKKVERYETSTNSDIFLVNLKDGTTKNITSENPGYDRVPKYSPDGKWIAYSSQERAGFESDRIRLMLYERATGAISYLSKTCDQWVEEFTWSPDSKSIYFVANDSGTVQIYHIDLTGNWKIITSGLHSIGGGLEITSDGKTLVFGKQTFTEPLELYTMPSIGGDMKKITNTNEELYKNIKMPTFKERWITSTDKKKVQCWMIYPPDFDSTKKYPMITYLQGGPQSMIGPNYHYRWNLAWMASNGYIILAANRRGVPGFGQPWNDAISKDWGGMPMNDYIAATDELSKEPYVDIEGRAALGASAGGYAAYWLAGHHQKRFKAFIAHCGVFDVVSKYGSTEELFFPNWEFGGPYWEAKHKPNFDKNSPHNYVQNWDTPIMISTGMNDFRVPYTQSLEAFTAARAQGIPAEIVIFPEETHFISHPQEFIIWSKEFMKFLDKYCKK